jgi:phage tail-like protein
MSHAKRLCLMLAVVLALSCCVLGMPEQRSYVSGNFFLTLDGVKCGYLKSIAGGGVSAEVIQEPAGPNYFVKKHIGQPKYEDLTLQVGFSMSKPLYEWIAQSWTMKYQRKSGSIIALDQSLAPKSERQFNQALITETTIPAMDGSSKEPAYMTVTFSPEFTRTVAPTGSKADYGEYGKNEQKMFLPSNFRLEIDGIDCSKVNKIESFTVKQTAVTDDIGDARDRAKEPGKLEFPNLKITVAEVAAQPFIDWHENFVIKGNNDESFEKGGMLTLLAPNQEKPLMRIRFYNLGIFRLQPAKAEANADQIKKVEVEMYVERMELLYGDDTGSTAPAAAPTTPPAAPRGGRRG